MLKGVFRMVAADRECERISNNASLSDSPEHLSNHVIYNFELSLLESQSKI